jgi:hypothetical protein
MAGHDKIDRQDRKEPQVPARFHEFLRFFWTDSISLFYALPLRTLRAVFFMPYRFAI